jgi:hypothetical protein
MKLSILALALGLLAAPAAGQHRASPPLMDCLRVDGGPNMLEGWLTRRTFAGPPNYQDVRHGDAPEPSYILVLPHDICISDGGQLADPGQLFRTVQLYANDARTRRALRAAIGRNVQVRGEPFAAHTGHHHAPLVMEVSRLVRLR